jgi:hypothetical protein
VPFDNESYRFLDGRWRISDGEQKIVPELVPCASNTGGGPGHAGRFSEQSGFFIMDGANRRDTETLQERAT